MPNLLTIKELAKVLFKSNEDKYQLRVWRLAKDKRIPCYKIGKQYFFNLDEVLAHTKKPAIRRARPAFVDEILGLRNEQAS